MPNLSLNADKIAQLKQRFDSFREIRDPEAEKTRQRDARIQALKERTSGRVQDDPARDRNRTRER